MRTTATFYKKNQEKKTSAVTTSSIAAINMQHTPKENVFLKLKKEIGMKSGFTLLAILIAAINFSANAQKNQKTFTENNRVAITLTSGEVLRCEMPFTWEMVKSVSEIDTVVSVFSAFENRMIDYPKEFRPVEKSFSKHVWANNRKIKTKDIKHMEVIKANRAHKFTSLYTPETIFSKYTLAWCAIKGDIELYSIDYCLEGLTGGKENSKSVDKRYFLVKNTPQGQMTYALKSNQYTGDLADAMKEIRYLTMNIGLVGFQYENIETLVKEYNTVMLGGETILSRRYGKQFGPSAQLPSKKANQGQTP